MSNNISDDMLKLQQLEKEHQKLKEKLIKNREDSKKMKEDNKKIREEIKEIKQKIKDLKKQIRENKKANKSKRTRKTKEVSTPIKVVAEIEEKSKDLEKNYKELQELTKNISKNKEEIKILVKDLDKKEEKSNFNKEQKSIIDEASKIFQDVEKPSTDQLIKSYKNKYFSYLHTILKYRRFFEIEPEEIAEINQKFYDEYENKVEKEYSKLDKDIRVDIYKKLLDETQEYFNKHYSKFDKDYNLRESVAIPTLKDLLNPKSKIYDKPAEFMISNIPILQKFSKKIKGSGLIDKIKSGVKIVKALITGRDDYPPAVRDFIKSHENNKIIKIRVAKAPISKVISKLGNVASLGELNKDMKKYSYDDLFHLWLEFTLDNNKTYTTEKDEVIKIREGGNLYSDREKNDFMDVKLKQPINIVDFFYKPLKAEGKKLLEYSAEKYNCQHYVISLLKYSNLDTPELHKFVLQNVFEMLNDKKYSFHKKVAKLITKLGEKIDIVRHGAGTDKLSDIDKKLKMLKKNLLPHLKSDEMRDVEVEKKQADIEKNLNKIMKRVIKHTTHDYKRDKKD